MVERVDHVNIVVVDLEKMAEFYCDVMGLRPAQRVTIGGAWIETVTGLAAAEADVALLEAGSGAGVELIRYRRPEGPRPESLGAPHASGIRHIAFRVDDIERAVGRMKSAGVEFLSDIQQVPTDQVDFVGKQKRIVYCRDPEGNLLELCDFA
jgi:catechol 2,3-dioxygenase-like lactoylglutathione lyase family enzyme